MTVTARQLCRWSAMQHPDALIIVREGKLLAVIDGEPRRIEEAVEVDGPTASAFEENGKARAEQ